MRVHFIRYALDGHRKHDDSKVRPVTVVTQFIHIDVMHDQ